MTVCMYVAKSQCKQFQLLPTVQVQAGAFKYRYKQYKATKEEI